MLFVCGRGEYEHILIQWQALTVKAFYKTISIIYLYKYVKIN